MVALVKLIYRGSGKLNSQEMAIFPIREQGEASWGRGKGLRDAGLHPGCH